MTLYMIRIKISVNGGMTAMNIQASDPPMINAITTEKISMTGQRNAIRTIII